MQMRPMVAVKKAAALLGVNKGELRAKLSAGQIQGERQVVGEKEKWFIYSSELDHLLDSMPGLVEAKERTTLDGLQKFFEPDSTPSLVEDVIYAEPLQIECVVEKSQAIEIEPALDLNKVIESLTIEFAYRLTEEHQKVLRLQDQLHEKDLVIQRLAPMEKALQLEVRQGCVKEVELKNLRSLIENLESEVAKLRMPWWKSIKFR